MTRFYPVPLYYSNVPAGESRNNCSNPLTNATTIAEILMIFPAKTNLDFTYRFFMIQRSPTDDKAFPGGGELTSTEAASGSFAGESISYSIPFQYTIKPASSVLCIYATNNTAAPLTASAIALIY